MRAITLFLILTLSCCSTGFAWGFWAHKRINRMAVFTLPPEMLGLYKRHISYLTSKATAPDMRRYAVQGEAFRHYIDIDKWGEYPFPDLPRTWSEVQEQYWEVWVKIGSDTMQLTGVDMVSVDWEDVRFFSENIQMLGGTDTLVKSRKAFGDFRRSNYPYASIYEPAPLSVQALNEFFQIQADTAWLIDPFTEYGVLPYELPRQIRRLSKAFEEGNLKKILRLSADIGHYVGDAHVPLHTTENYNGQLTNQKGIHGFWESRIPELFAENYDFLIGSVESVPSLEGMIWASVLESHQAVDSVLDMERELNERFPEDRKYGYESRNNVVTRVYSREYTKAYSDMMDGMVERRMRMAIQRLGVVWYTAWARAGKPDLKPLYEKEVDDAPDKFDKKLKIIDREAQGFGFQRVFMGEPLLEKTAKASILPAEILGTGVKSYLLLLLIGLSFFYFLRIKQ